MKDQIQLTVEELEERIGPSVHGTGGYDGRRQSMLGSEQSVWQRQPGTRTL
jgi:hypothetical protein